MALDEASHHFLNFRSPEIRATGIRTCPDVELGEECEDQCYLGQGSKITLRMSLRMSFTG